MKYIDSILREQEYIKLSQLEINGEILDIGGSKKSGYHELIKGSHKITTVNIDPGYDCDMVFDIQNRFPIDDNKFDAVMAINVLEHIYDFHNVFREVYRVLSKGGRFILFTPFIHHIHGSPDDYFRYTKSALIKLLSENGYLDIKIEELGFGLFSFIYQTTGGIFPEIVMQFLKRTCIGLDKLLLHSKKYQKLISRIPLGYYVSAKK